MKKGIVMELHRKYTIIMTKEGSFQKAILIKDAVIGAEVTYKQLEANKRFNPREMSNPVRLIAMACIVLLFMLPFYFTMGQKETYAYVNIDINPSIELEIDESLYVKKIRPLNEDASKIIEGLLEYENKKLAIVVDMIMDESEKTGLINKGKNMLVGVSYVAEKDVKNFTLLDNLKRYFSKRSSSWQIAAFKVPKKVRDKAENHNKSMNEVMATTIIGTENVTDNDAMDDKDKAIINSFYNMDIESNTGNSDKTSRAKTKVKEKNGTSHTEEMIEPNKNKDKKNNENKTKKKYSGNNGWHKGQDKGQKHPKDNGKHNGQDKGQKHPKDDGKHNGPDKRNKHHKDDNGKHKSKDKGIKHHENRGKHIGKDKGRNQYKDNNGKYRDQEKKHKRSDHNKHRNKNKNKNNGNH